VWPLMAQERAPGGDQRLGRTAPQREIDRPVAGAIRAAAGSRDGADCRRWSWVQ
jgi:hypothetical protein